MRSHSFWEHPVVAGLEAGTLGKNQLRALMEQLGPVSFHSTGYLGRLIAVCPFEEFRILLGMRLSVELGEGNAEGSLLRRFGALCSALGLPAVESSELCREPETEELVEDLVSLPDRLGLEPALGVLCLGLDAVDERLDRSLRSALLRTFELPEAALAYFQAKKRCRELSAPLRGLLQGLLTNRLIEDEVEGALNGVLDARARFLDGAVRSGRRRDSSPFSGPRWA